jgi:hypothetical protein
MIGLNFVQVMYDVAIVFESAKQNKTKQYKVQDQLTTSQSKSRRGLYGINQKQREELLFD